MNSYQRGNRDGLLSFAAFAKKQADIYGDDIAKRAEQQLKTRRRGLFEFFGGVGRS